MAIRKVDGRRFLDSGTIIVAGDNAVIEIDFQFRNTKHEVALKFRTAINEKSHVKFGNPRPDRTVVHFINFPLDQPSTSGGMHIGYIGEEKHKLTLALSAQPLPPPEAIIRWVTYTLYADGPDNG